MTQPTEPPDLTEELKEVADERAARIRRTKRLRAVMAVRRSFGVDRRNEAHMDRINRERRR